MGIVRGGPGLGEISPAARSSRERVSRCAGEGDTVGSVGFVARVLVLWKRRVEKVRWEGKMEGEI